MNRKKLHMNFQELLTKQKNASDNLAKTASAAQSETTRSEGNQDDRFWRPALDKAGNGFAVIRFLPDKESETPWAKFYTHGFNGPATGKWFIENCPTTLGNDCPVCKANGALWNSGIESDKQIARERKRRLHYVSNIVVLSDKQNPENVGRVFLYKYGAKIFAKLMEAMQPAFEDETPINPFNFFEGADFKLKIKQVEGYWNYDSSEFNEASALYDGDTEKLEEVYKAMHDLKEFTDPSNFKTFDQLKTRFDEVMDVQIEPAKAMKSEAPKPTKSAEPKSAETTESSNEEPAGDDDMDYFRKLAETM